MPTERPKSRNWPGAIASSSAAAVHVIEPTKSPLRSTSTSQPEPWVRLREPAREDPLLAEVAAGDQQACDQQQRRERQRELGRSEQHLRDAGRERAIAMQALKRRWRGMSVQP
jgi:hypothetical protein